MPMILRCFTTTKKERNIRVAVENSVNNYFLSNALYLNCKKTVFIEFGFVYRERHLSYLVRVNEYT